MDLTKNTHGLHPDSRSNETLYVTLSDGQIQKMNRSVQINFCWTDWNRIEPWISWKLGPPQYQWRAGSCKQAKF